jgi:hypothetical protein
MISAVFEPKGGSAMKSSPLFVAVLAGLVMYALPGSACSNTTIQGSYGFLLTGTNSSGLAAVVGQITADGKGGLTGSETISNDGAISSNVTLTGTYSIKPACTGTATITPSGFPTAKYNLTVVATGKQIEMVDTDAGTTQFGYALARGNSACTNAAIKGTFGFVGGGFDSSLVPKAFDGQVKLDGAGNLTGAETVSAGGTVFSGALSGTYSVNSDCTGSVSVTFKKKKFGNNFVIVNGDKSALEISTDAGSIGTTTVAKQ